MSSLLTSFKSNRNTKLLFIDYDRKHQFIIFFVIKSNIKIACGSMKQDAVVIGSPPKRVGVSPRFDSSRYTGSERTSSIARSIREYSRDSRGKCRQIARVYDNRSSTMVRYFG